MNLIGKNAKTASVISHNLSTKDKNKVLNSLGDNLLKHKNKVFSANKIDVENGKDINLSAPLIDRLVIDEERLQGMVDGLKDVVKLDDPIGDVLETKSLDNGLEVNKISVPLGVIGIIYESRPNVTVDAFALCFKAGNAAILKGGKEALETNIVLERIIRETLVEHSLDANIIQLIKDTDRATTKKLMKLDKYVDVLIPRGSAALINVVLRESTIPVIETGAGNCHIFVDKSANQDDALKIIENAKLQRPGVCNAIESLVIHNDIAETFIQKLMDYIPSVTVFGDEASVEIDSRIKQASDDDFFKEYLDESLSLKIVESMEEAISHINEHHTGHSDAILTSDETSADLFTRNVDSAAVYVNASTRFTDGFVFGLGAEIGISTQKLHARGPMGLKALTTYKYIIKGNGQVR